MNELSSGWVPLGYQNATTRLNENPLLFRYPRLLTVGGPYPDGDPGWRSLVSSAGTMEIPWLSLSGPNQASARLRKWPQFFFLFFSYPLHEQFRMAPDSSLPTTLLLEEAFTPSYSAVLESMWTFMLHSICQPLATRYRKISFSFSSNYSRIAHYRVFCTFPEASDTGPSQIQTEYWTWWTH